MTDLERREARRALATARDRLADLAARLDRAGAAAPSTGWRSPAARTAQAALGRRAVGLRSVAAALDLAVQALDRLEREVDDALAEGAMARRVLLAPLPGAVVAAGEAAELGRAAAVCTDLLRAAADRCHDVVRALTPGAATAERLAEERDAVNRARLAARLSSWHAGSSGPAGSAAWAAHRADLQLRAQLDRVRLDPLTGARLRVLLTVYDPGAWDGRGRAELVLGDLDTAADMAVLVPGLGVRLDPGLPGLADEAWRLYVQTRRAAAGAGVATVAWLGYRTPDLRDVATAGRAVDGSRALASELTRLRRELGDAQPRVTLVGHSYGSLTAALAVAAAPGSVDDLAVVGSPGLGVDDARELPLPDGHVWVGAASGDPVSHLSRFGTDPAAAGFGAHRFPAETPGRAPVLDQHTHYLDEGSASLRSLATVVAGRVAALPTVPGRTDHGWAGSLTALAVPPVLWLVLPPPDLTFGDPAGRCTPC